MELSCSITRLSCLSDAEFRAADLSLRPSHCLCLFIVSGPGADSSIAAGGLNEYDSLYLTLMGVPFAARDLYL